MAETIAYKITSTDSTGEQIINYIAPDKAQQFARIMDEEGYNVETEEVTELPDGVEI